MREDIADSQTARAKAFGCTASVQPILDALKTAHSEIDAFRSLWELQRHCVLEVRKLSSYHRDAVNNQLTLALTFHPILGGPGRDLLLGRCRH